MNSIDIFGIRILEPVGSGTDLLVSAVCFYAFYMISTRKSSDILFTYYKLYFLLMGIATIFGGLLGHAFMHYINFAWKLPGWLISMLAIMLVERASIEHTRSVMNPKIVRVFKIVNTVELSIFVFLTFYFMDFFFVELHSGYGLMFVVLSLHAFLYYTNKNAASKTILWGVGVAAVAALIFMNEISIHQWFNHLALSHTIMALSAWLFYKGVMKIEDIKPTV
jgi:hypothetical protein